MTAHHPSRPMLVAALVAMLLVSVAAPAADARLPKAKAYRVGGPITLDTNLLSASGVSAWAIDEYLSAHTPLPALGAAFIAAERTYGVNARFLLAAALHESGWGRSSIARHKRNLFGYNAFDRNPLRYANAYATYAANIDDTARFMKEAYLSPGGRWWRGQPTLRSMQQSWSSSGSWGSSIARMASSIRLATLAGRSVAFAAPLVSGPLHAGDDASIELTWKGGAIPDAIEFVATWEPLELDADAIAAATSALGTQAAGDEGVFGDGPATADPDQPGDALAAPPPAAPSLTAPTGEAQTLAPGDSTPAPSAISALRVRSDAHAIHLALAAPVDAGRYSLHLEMRDAGGTPLPVEQRIAIPSAEVRIWGDRAVTYTIEATTDGTGALVHVTNMGRTVIPVRPIAPSPGWLDRAAEPDRTVVTVTATGGPGGDSPQPIATWPLATDLPPGASIDFEVPAIASTTGRSASRLTVSLSVPGDPAWLAAYPPALAWFPIGSEVGAVGGPDPSSPVATPTPTPVPTPRPTAPPAPVTTTFAEDSPAIEYGGSWGDAANPAYLGRNVRWSKTPGSTATFTFTGSRVTWIGPMGPTRGLARVLIDGQPVARVSMWRSTFDARAVLFEHSFASSGRHTLTIEVLSMPSHPYVAVDAFTVRS
jgi:hypothetical protein